MADCIAGPAITSDEQHGAVCKFRVTIPETACTRLPDRERSESIDTLTIVNLNCSVPAIPKASPNPNLIELLNARLWID